MTDTPAPPTIDLDNDTEVEKLLMQYSGFLTTRLKELEQYEVPGFTEHIKTFLHWRPHVT